MTPNEPTPSPALALVHEGWRQLQLQRPLAAWACWQRALLVDPDDPAARQALARLEDAGDLPASARTPQRFLPPSGEERRLRWDAELRDRSGGLDDLNDVVDAFGRLAAHDPADSEAWYNQALCLAWLGRNAEAVAALDRYVARLADSDPDRAAGAWCLAEVLRLGAGAEDLCDDLRYTWTLAADGGHVPVDLLRWPFARPVEVPVDPLEGGKVATASRIEEWYDRPIPGPDDRPRSAADLPRLLTLLIVAPSVVRLSFPDPTQIDEFESDPAFEPLAGLFAAARREKTPLPLPQADLPLGSFLLPAGLDDAARAALTREVVEHYYEDLWIHQPRQALGGLTPLQASRGDAVARARLRGVVNFREQLGARPSRAPVYQGYPFDRLRRRLGLLDVASLPPDDLACLGEAELAGLDPSTLEDHRLADACRSAAGLRDDALTARFGAEILNRAGDRLALDDPEVVVAPLVREALRLNDADEAFEQLDRASAASSDRSRRTLAVWAAELKARTGDPEAALAIYRRLLERPDASALDAIDGAETLLDNRHFEEAVTLLEEARDRARSAGDSAIASRADSLLKSVSGR